MSTLDAFSGEKIPPWYVTGFAESAGSFTFSRSGKQLLLVFAVRFPESNRPLLEGIRRFFRAGRIYVAGPGCYDRINRPMELLRVVDHFDRYPLRGEKQIAYRIWREMVHVKATHHGSRPPQRLDDLARKLSRTVRKRGKQP